MNQEFKNEVNCENCVRRRLQNYSPLQNSPQNSPLQK